MQIMFLDTPVVIRTELDDGSKCFIHKSVSAIVTITLDALGPSDKINDDGAGVVRPEIPVCSECVDSLIIHNRKIKKKYLEIYKSEGTIKVEESENAG